jgi:hypothetical protein
MSEDELTPETASEETTKEPEEPESKPKGKRAKTLEANAPALDAPERDFEAEVGAAKQARDFAEGRLLQAASLVDHTAVQGVARENLLAAARAFADAQNVLEATEATE